MILGSHDIASDLRALGISSGDGVFVHTALGKVGHVIAGPRGYIQGLIDAVGPTGLVGMPGFSTDAYDPAELLGMDVSAEQQDDIRRHVPGFDPCLSNARQNGSVPEAFRSWPGVSRSLHPTSSVLLLGPDAEALCHPHDPKGWPTGPQTPWGRLRSRPQMKLLLVGVGWNRCSALHAAESVARHRRTVTRTLKLGTGPDAPWIQAPDVCDDLDRLFPLVGADWEETGGVTTGMVGNAVAKVTGYDELVAFASEWISERNRADGIGAS